MAYVKEHVSAKTDLPIAHLATQLHIHHNAIHALTNIIYQTQ
jgi:hypothetical protein